MGAPTETSDSPGAGLVGDVLPRTAAFGRPTPAPPRQRWRLVLSRSADAPDLGGRELTDVWESALELSDLPAFVPGGRARARVAFGAPLMAGLIAEAELADIVLTGFEPVWRVRTALEGCLPQGWRLVDLYDVWLGAPPLAGQVIAADYRIQIHGAEAADIARGVAAVLAAPHVPRERQKGAATVTYDLRPLIAHLDVVAPGPPVVLGARTRFHPELGTGRPSEVVGAIGDVLGVRLTVVALVREHLVLAE